MMRTFYKLFLIGFLGVVTLSCSNKDDGTPMTIELQNTEQVAKVIARIQYEKESYESKEEQKIHIDEVLYNYGIDTYEERTKFAKKAQKYSYQKGFNRHLINELDRLRKQKAQ